MANKVIAAKEAVEKQEEQSLTPEDFIVRWPLYTPFPVDGKFTAPRKISVHCEGRCAKETTWNLVTGPEFAYDTRGMREGFYWVAYVCGLCDGEQLTVCYRQSHFRRGPNPEVPGLTKAVLARIQKIGQYPPLSISLPRALEKNLGSEATQLYKKAQINRNEGYGLGAVTYIRRVVEDKTEELIEVVAQLAEAHSVGADVIKKIRAAKETRTTYDQKLQIAATVIPASLIVDGVNPLAVLYDLVSAGLHDLTEEQCIAIADKTKTVFEFTFTNLRAEREKRKDFVETVKRLAGEKGPAK